MKELKELGCFDLGLLLLSDSRRNLLEDLVLQVHDQALQVIQFVCAWLNVLISTEVAVVLSSFNKF